MAFSVDLLEFLNSRVLSIFTIVVKFFHLLFFSINLKSVIILDSASENYIQKAIERLRQQNKTIVIIAHRLSAVINAEEIIVLQKGQVLEQGNHQELYKSKGHYYDLWQQQMPKSRIGITRLLK